MPILQGFPLAASLVQAFQRLIVTVTTRCSVLLINGIHVSRTQAVMGARCQKRNQRGAHTFDDSLTAAAEVHVG